MKHKKHVKKSLSTELITIAIYAVALTTIFMISLIFLFGIYPDSSLTIGVVWGMILQIIITMMTKK